MRRYLARFAAILAAASILAVTAAADPVTAPVVRFFTLQPGSAAPPDPRDFGGGFCAKAVARTGAARVWWGRFAGGRASAGERSDGAVVHSTEGCFPSRATCERWLLALKSAFNEKPVYNQCRAGYEPGAHLPPWWAPGQ